MKTNKIKYLIIAVLTLSVLSLTLASCGWISGIKGEKPEGIADWDQLEKNPELKDDAFDGLIRPDQLYTVRSDLSGQELIDYMNGPEYEALMEALIAADGKGAAYDPEVLENSTGTGTFTFDEKAAEITGVVVDPKIVEMYEKIKEEAGEDWDDPDPSGDPSGNTDSLPEQYAKLIPDTLLAKTDLTLMESSFMLTGSASKGEYEAVVNALKASGYTTIQEMELDGILLYSANSESDAISVSFTDGVFSMVITR